MPTPQSSGSDAEQPDETDEFEIPDALKDVDEDEEVTSDDLEAVAEEINGE